MPLQKAGYQIDNMRVEICYKAEILLYSNGIGGVAAMQIARRGEKGS